MFLGTLKKIVIHYNHITIHILANSFWFKRWNGIIWFELSEVSDSDCSTGLYLAISLKAIRVSAARKRFFSSSSSKD